MTKKHFNFSLRDEHQEIVATITVLKFSWLTI